MRAGWWLAWVAVGALGFAPRLTGAPPNIIHILADDVGYDDFGCFGCKDIATPNVDALAARGTRFTSFYAPHPTCTASRAALLTGCYAVRVGLPPVLFPDSKIGLNADEVTIAELLKAKGYATACVGKWHRGWGWPAPVGGRRDFTRPIPEGPTARGFDRYFGTDVPNYPPYCFLDHDRTFGISGPGDDDALILVAAPFGHYDSPVWRRPECGSASEVPAAQSLP